MRLTASALGLSLALLSVAHKASADTILPASCATVPALCGYTPKASGSLTVSANPYLQRGTTYTTPAGGLSTDSHTVSASELGVFSGSASGSFTVDYSGIHSVVAAQGDGYELAPNGNPYVGGVSSSASVNAEILDYFYTSSPIPTGASISLTYTVDATGISGNTGHGGYDASLAGYFNTNALASNPVCTNTIYSSPYAPNLNGSFATSCTVLLRLTQSQVVSADLQLDTSAVAYDGSTTLDASNTAKITSVLVVDSAGNPLPDIQLYDASGNDYDAVNIPPPSAVPEPSALLLLATGSLGLAGQLRRRLYS
jgi:hypothetical protein